jgi:hypothetical protein
LIGKRLKLGGVILQLGAQKVIGEGLSEHLEPEARELRQNPALARDAFSHDHIEGRQTVRGDDEKLPRPGLIHISDFAAGEKPYAAQSGLREHRLSSYSHVGGEEHS